MPNPNEPISLAKQAWLNEAALQRTLAVITAGGHGARVVGGAVRNALMGREVGDIDIATTATPEEVIALVSAAGLKAIPTGIAHGTITVVANGTPFEVTTLRHDVETDGRHAIVAFTDDWAADAARRDFTMNALYCDASGTVLDPLNGYPDLTARRVRFIGDARQRIQEDYLRILRFFRFIAEYGGNVDETGLAAVTAERDGLRRLSGERVRIELLRLLGAPFVARSVDAMERTGILDIVLGGAADVSSFHRLVADEGEREAEGPSSPLLRLAALAGVVPEKVDAIRNRLRLSNAEADELLRITRAAASAIAEIQDAARVRAFIYRHGNAAARHGIYLAVARDLLHPGQDWRQALELANHWSPPRLAVTGQDILALGIPAGARVGRILSELEDWWIGQDFRPTADEQRDKLAQIAR